MYMYIGLIGKQTRKFSLSVTENSPETLPAIEVWPTCLSFIGNKAFPMSFTSSGRAFSLVPRFLRPGHSWLRCR